MLIEHKEARRALRNPSGRCEGSQRHYLEGVRARRAFARVVWTFFHLELIPFSAPNQADVKPGRMGPRVNFNAKNPEL